jgi:hypothetical protein
MPSAIGAANLQAVFHGRASGKEKRFENPQNNDGTHHHAQSVKALTHGNLSEYENV